MYSSERWGKPSIVSGCYRGTVGYQVLFLQLTYLRACRSCLPRSACRNKEHWRLLRLLFFVSSSNNLPLLKKTAGMSASYTAVHCCTTIHCVKPVAEHRILYITSGVSACLLHLLARLFFYENFCHEGRRPVECTRSAVWARQKDPPPLSKAETLL